MKTIKIIYTLLIVTVLLNACTTKDKDPKPAKTGMVNVFFDNKVWVDNQFKTIVFDNNTNANDTTTALAANAALSNAFGNELTINKLYYWVSKVQFTMEDGTVFKEKDSYHLIQLDGSLNKQAFTVSGVPLGHITKITFSIGVDPEPNGNKDIIKGDLNPNIGMSWDWNTGYIFLKMEGRFKKSNGNFRYYRYHIGLNDNYKTLTLDLPEHLDVEESGILSIHLKNNALAVFGLNGVAGSTVLDLNTNHTIHMGGTRMTNAANNYAAAMFKVDHVHQASGHSH